MRRCLRLCVGSCCCCLLQLCRMLLGHLLLLHIPLSLCFLLGQ
jgi:hypothetical protein